MNITIDVDTKKLNTFDLTLQAQSDLLSTDVTSVMRITAEAVTTKMRSQIHKVQCSASLEGAGIKLVVVSDHLEHWSMRQPAKAAKADLETAGHTVTYSEIDGWTDEEKLALRGAKVRRLNVNSIRR